METAPRIDPDYAGIIIPPNIAPLNFRVLEDGSDCVVRISSDGAAPVRLHCPERQCRMSAFFISPFISICYNFPMPEKTDKLNGMTAIESFIWQIWEANFSVFSRRMRKKI